MYRVAIVLGYGVFSDDPEVRTREDMLNYRAYLDKVASRLTEIKPNLAVVCGGYTNPKSMLSEAASIVPYLRAKSTVTFSVRVEDQSSNTAQNLAYALPIVVKAIPDNPQRIELVILCDRLRGLKVWILAWKLYKSYRWKVITVPREDIHPNSRWLKQLVEAGRYLVTPTNRLVK